MVVHVGLCEVCRVVGGCEGAGVGGQGCGGPAVADAVHVGDGAVVAAPLVVVQPIHRA